MNLDQFSLFVKKITTLKTKRGKYLPLHTLDPKVFLTEPDAPRTIWLWPSNQLAPSPSVAAWSPPSLTQSVGRCAGVGATKDSRQLSYSSVHFSLVVAYPRVRHTRARRTLEYATPW